MKLQINKVKQSKYPNRTTSLPREPKQEASESQQGETGSHDHGCKSKQLFTLAALHDCTAHLLNGTLQLTVNGLNKNIFPVCSENTQEKRRIKQVGPKAQRLAKKELDHHIQFLLFDRHANRKVANDLI